MARAAYQPVAISGEHVAKMRELAAWRDRSLAAEVRLALAAWVKREYPKLERARERGDA